MNTSKLVICVSLTLLTGFGVHLPAIHAQTETTDSRSEAEACPVFEARFLGVSKSGNEARYLLREPGTRCVKTLSLELLFGDKEGNVHIAAGRHFNYPFADGSELVLDIPLREADEAFRKLASASPEDITIISRPYDLTFDDDTPGAPRRISITESQKSVTLDYMVHPGEVVFFGTSERRWGQTWVRPLTGYTFPDNSIDKELCARARITFPEATKNGRWNLFCGIADSYSGSGIKPSVEPLANEMRLPIRDVEAPVRMERVEVHIIPFRIVDAGTDSLIIAIADDIREIKKYIKLNPHERDFDWEKHLHPASTSGSLDWDEKSKQSQ